MITVYLRSLAVRVVAWATVPARTGPMVRDPKKLGGSDAAAVCGKDPHKTAYHVAQRILGEIQSDELEGLDHIEFGNEMEGVLGRFYERKQKVRLYTPQTIIHPKYPFLSVNIDRLREDRMDVAIECKNVGLHVTEPWGEPGTDDVPPRVLLQCVHGMMVCRQLSEFHVLRCYGGNTYQMFVLPRNEALIESLLEIELEFMHNLQRGVLPEPEWGHRTTKETLKKAFRKLDGPIEEKPELAVWTQAWEEAAAERLRCAKLEESIKNHIEHIMGNAEVGVLPDGRKWRRKSVRKKAYEVEASEYIECRLLK